MDLCNEQVVSCHPLNRTWFEMAEKEDSTAGNVFEETGNVLDVLGEPWTKKYGGTCTIKRGQNSKHNYDGSICKVFSEWSAAEI